MKNRIILVFVLLIICAFFCSCTINPHAFDWDLLGISHEVTYINGQTVLTWTSTGAYEHQPNGIHDGMVSIKFYEDGTVDFKPYDSDMLHGTYNLKHNGLKDTNFTVIFENGEKIENGYAVGYYYDDELNFDFRGIRYRFTTDSRGCTEEEYDKERASLVDWIRRGGTSVRAGKVTLNESGAELSSESLESNIDLYGENCALTVMQITAENELLTLDEIKEGECVFYEFLDTKQPHGKAIHTVVIYYIEPLPEDLTPPTPAEYSLEDIIPRLEYYFEHSDESRIKISRSLSPIQPGQNDYHKYYTEQADIERYISALKEITLTEELDEPIFGDIEMAYTVRFSHIEGLKNDAVIKLIGDYVKLGDKYYRVSSFPRFEYEGAVMTFTMLNNDLKVYSKDEYMYDADGYLLDVEFIIDPEDYEYMPSHYTLTLVCELGEITVYDNTHFWYKGQFYLVVSEKNFSEFY